MHDSDHTISRMSDYITSEMITFGYITTDIVTYDTYERRNVAASYIP